MIPVDAVLHYLATHGESDVRTIQRATGLADGALHRLLLALSEAGDIEGRTVRVAGLQRARWSATAQGLANARRSA